MVFPKTACSFCLTLTSLLGSSRLAIADQAALIRSDDSRISQSEALQANSNQTPAGVLSNGVLTINLDVREGQWFPEDDRGPSVKIFALAEQGKAAQVPGPMIRVREGTTIHLTIRNPFSVPVVVHGMHPRPGKEGDILEVPPAKTCDVTFQAGEPGAYYYWATAGGDLLGDRPYKEDSQLNGAFIVDPAGEVPPDRVFVISAWRDRHQPQESFDIPVINGKSWPYTERLQYVRGSEVRWRWLNPSAQLHPMHLQGSYFRVDAMGDGERDIVFPIAQRRSVVTQLIPIGGTMTTYWKPNEPGRWLFHCHILTHVSPDTMMLRHDVSGAHSNMAHDTPMKDMAGLVMGITILPRPGDPKPPKPPKPQRKFSLVIAKKQGEENKAGYALIERGKPATAVSAPGPPLLLTRGEPVAIRVINRLSEPTSVHWHGIELQSFFDGVPGWTGAGDQVTPMIQPGKSFDVYINPPRAGTFIYHTHMNDMPQLSSGLYGPIIVLSPGETFQPETDRVFVISRNGMRSDGGLLLNGTAEPEPQRWIAGRQYRLRFININANNTIIVNLLRDGVPATWKAFAKDGADLPPEQALAAPATFLIAPGETYDFQFRAEREGNIELTLDLLLLKEKVTQAIRVESEISR